MGDPAGVRLPLRGFEGGALGQVELPVLLEGQVGLIGVLELGSILQKLDGDVRRVEVVDMADQDVVLPIHSRVPAVHLNLG